MYYFYFLDDFTKYFWLYCLVQLSEGLLVGSVINNFATDCAFFARANVTSTTQGSNQTNNHTHNIEKCLVV
jgi:hypothetical protein